MLPWALICFVPGRGSRATGTSLGRIASPISTRPKPSTRDLDAAFEETGLNVYPVILCGLRRLGMDWTMAGAWWSVLMATAAVLPLFGWVRRQFDDQVASAACLAYAFHGKLMAVSVLIIRDPTFWFLFNLTLYLFGGPSPKSDWRLFLGAGPALTPAVHTRSEGWLLVVPLLLWPAFRCRRWPEVPCGRRWKLAGGTALCLAMVPFCMALVNLTWLRDAPRWGLVRSARPNFAGLAGLGTRQAGGPAESRAAFFAAHQRQRRPATIGRRWPSKRTRWASRPNPCPRRCGSPARPW